MRSKKKIRFKLLLTAIWSKKQKISKFLALDVKEKEKLDLF